MRTALIVWGGWNGHDPEECAAIYRRWLHEDGFSVRVETDTAVFGDPSIHDLSLIVPIFTMSKIEREHAQNFAKDRDNHLVQGKGLLATRDLISYANLATQLGIALASVAAMVRVRRAFDAAICVGVIGVAIALYALGQQYLATGLM